MTVADKIRSRRIELGLTQLDVAKRLGLTTKAAVSKIENKGDKIKLSTVEKYADVLDCTPAYLMGWDNETTDRVKRFTDLYSQLDEEHQDIIDSILASYLSKK